MSVYREMGVQQRPLQTMELMRLGEEHMYGSMLQKPRSGGAGPAFVVLCLSSVFSAKGLSPKDAGILQLYSSDVFTDMILHRYVVSRVIWAYMLSIAVTYSITLCLFPGLESEIRNPTLGEWLPILIMATFNMSDFVGKVRAPYN